MLLRIPSSIYTDMLAYCVEQNPAEACGLLISAAKSPHLITELLPLTNVSDTPEHAFTVDPEQWIKTLFTVEQQGSTITGLFHSHPYGAALPSQADLRGLWHTVPSHWIISLQHKQTPIVAAFRYEANGSFKHVAWQIVPSTVSSASSH